MIIPYEYRGFTIEGFYDPTPEGKMRYSIYATHPNIEGCQCLSGFETYQEAKDDLETRIDELIASWN